ncbi:ATP-binding protein [uncultured Desulfuromusa sp.]|uniref:sensor histidine kinase n=1 Tax=uncultured Desulfuromusa sp. TaxID=219183 RepID=UPI002AA831AE|nr:ATP-binding protein [uncultured Desulfuromusa sp.]
MIKTVGLRTEILITLTLLLGAALLLGGIMMLRLMEKSLLEERVGQLESLSNILAQSLVMNANDMSLLTRLPDNLNYVNWRVYDEDLNTINSYVAEGISPFSSSRRQMAKLSADPQRKVHFPTLLNLFDQSEPFVHFLLPLRADKRFYGLLELSFSLADIRSNLSKSQQLIVIYVVLYGAVLILAGYYLLQRNIVNPARNLLKATEEVSCGNLETRLPTAGPTEIRQLAVAYNHMVEALQTSRGETELHIASLEEINRELQRARAELIRSEKMASVGQLAAGLAHELGNPLAALIGYLEILKQKIETGSEKDIIERSLVETNRIDFLVRELLDFSRPTDAAQVESVDLVFALNSSVQLLKNQGALADIEIIDNLPETLPPISIDPNKLQQVLINLLLNAAQACAKKGKITLSSGVDEASVWLGIRDNGCGIVAADLNKIFDPFFTTKSPGEGTGLGLAICQRIIEEIGGTIDVESSVGEGSLFKIIFPKTP